MREGMPDSAPGKKAQVRAAMTRDASACTRPAGSARSRCGDRLPGRPLGANGHVPRVIPSALSRKTRSVLGSAHQPTPGPT